MAGNLNINNLSDLWPIIRKRKWLIILPWIMVAVIVGVGSYFLTPEYQASAIVQLNREVNLSSEMQGLLSLGRTRSDEGARQDELRGYFNQLTSTKYVTEVAQQLKLDQDPELTRQAQRAAAAHPGMSVEDLKIFLLQSSLRSKVSVSSVGLNQIQISASSASPSKSRDIANTLSNIFLAEQLRQDFSSIRSSQDFTDQQLQKYEHQLEQKIQERTEFERNYLRNQPDTIVMSEVNRSQIQSEIDQTQTDIEDRQRQERNLLSQLQNVAGLATGQLTLKDSDESIKSKDDLKTQLRTVSSMLLKYTWSDPQMLNFRLRQSSVLSQIEAETRRLVNQQFSSLDATTKGRLGDLFTTRTDLDYFYSKVTYLKSSLDELKDRINRIPEYQATMDRFNREITAATELRDKFKNQQVSSNISQALLQDMSSSKYRLIEAAQLPLTPVRPNKVKIIGLGIVLGLVIGASAAVVAELLDSSFRKVGDVEETLGLKVVGVSPRIEFMKRLLQV